MWQDSQMIVTGGLATLGLGITASLNDVCNETYPPIRVLDTSTHTWRTQFHPRLEYSVPDTVTAMTGGNSKGGAVLNFPAAGWSSDELSTIFSQRVARDSDDSTASTGAAAHSASDDSGDGLSGGAIAGIVVGFIAVLTALLLVSFLSRRKRLQRARAAVTESVQEEIGQQKAEVEAHERWRHELDMGTALYETHATPVIARTAERPVQPRPSELP
ncbi:hypothetical protein B0J12DRAFT_60686 [Macrophomina phaseolina]|uniref:Transmembrane protein n=1 Tax=Macrophomina phaseolina TaxID=35725 RepID=A0ABQ8GCC2_9PEZI|nr:hypothetical protein B0J12DRAFT_60686 [Macrophomina phaseolina]